MKCPNTDLFLVRKITPHLETFHAVSNQRILNIETLMSDQALKERKTLSNYFSRFKRIN